MYRELVPGAGSERAAGSSPELVAGIREGLVAESSTKIVLGREAELELWLEVIAIARIRPTIAVAAIHLIVLSGGREVIGTPTARCSTDAPRVSMSWRSILIAPRCLMGAARILLS